MWIRRIVIAVLLVQLVGIAATMTWERAPDPLGPFLWATSFLSLLPGDVLAPTIVEHFLWQRGPSLRSIDVIDLFASVFVNMAIASICFVPWLVRRRAA